MTQNSKSGPTAVLPEPTVAQPLWNRRRAVPVTAGLALCGAAVVLLQAQSAFTASVALAGAGCLLAALLGWLGAESRANKLAADLGTAQKDAANERARLERRLSETRLLVDESNERCRLLAERMDSVGFELNLPEGKRGLVDNSDRQQVEKALASSRQQLGEAMDLARLAFWEHAPGQGVFTFNDRFYALHGTNAQREGGYQLSTEVYVREFLYPEDALLVAHEVEQAMRDPDGHIRRQVEHRIRRRDGETRIVHVRIDITKDEAGRIIKVYGTTQDVTEQRRIQEELGASLKEKEVLLREVYHRVKNNLQVISSLLNLQSEFIKDPGTLRLIRETQDRVRSMALVHEKLYRAKDLSRIDFGEYARQLVNMLVRSYRTDNQIVAVQFELDEVLLNLDTAVPCGLILNELVSNSLKYAFPSGRIGAPAAISILLKKQDDGRVLLIVGDNGIGLPEQFDLNHTTSLGLQVVCLLGEQLGGTVNFERHSGTQFQVCFRELVVGRSRPGSGSPQHGKGPVQPSLKMERP